MYKRMLVCLDLTTGSNEVAKKAWQISQQLAAKPHFLHVIEPIQAYGYPGITEIETALVDQARQDLGNLVKGFNVAPTEQMVIIGPTKHEILRVAKEIKADLIIVGSHGKHGLSLLLGSTANAILHNANCDVLTLRMGE